MRTAPGGNDAHGFSQGPSSCPAWSPSIQRWASLWIEGFIRGRFCGSFRSTRMQGEADGGIEMPGTESFQLLRPAHQQAHRDALDQAKCL
jgi:hypothetical protein